MRASLRSVVVAVAVVLAAQSAHAQNTGVGFQLNRYEPTMPGAWFLAVEHPWYSSTRWFSGGLTLDYGHNPLVYGIKNTDGSFTEQTAVVANQFVGHLDLAASFLDRVNVGVTVPVTFVETGTSAGGVSALGSPSFGDPRVGVWVRLFGQPDRSPVSLHVGGHLWIPVGVQDVHQGDRFVRGTPKILLAGLAANHFRWSASVGYLIRETQTIGQVSSSAGATVGQELQVGLAGQYTNAKRTWALGPEVLLATVVNDPANTNSTSFFNREYTSLELLASGHVLFAKQILLSLGAGVGLLRQPGTPDFRAMARLVWAPERVTDKDKDGVPDDVDACPSVKGIKDKDPKLNGCPSDRDHDGVADEQDLCPDVSAGEHPDAKKPGCPVGDTDKDGFFDYEDQCPEVPAGDFPDAAKLGCPMPDADADGVPDSIDKCPDVAQGPKPDPDKRGCPLVEKPKTDKDGDGVFDDEDQCPDVPAGLNPDADKKGCPAPDKDADNIPDKVDACPDKPGAPDPDPKKNGCPGLVQIKNCKIEILSPVFFATDKDVILPKSFPVLTGVSNALKLSPQIKLVEVEGHTDSQGNLQHNTELSDRRAKSVVAWLKDKGAVEAARLQSHGYGPAKPIADNKTAAGRAQNRRVDFRIIDPVCDDKPAAPTKSVAAPAAPTKAPAAKAAPVKGGPKKGGRKAK